MMRIDKRLIVWIAMLAGVAVYSAICLHSVEEIHYLKTFFPKQFTVEEAFYAAAIELIKVAIIGIPFLLLIVVCAVMLRESNKGKDHLKSN
jgi:hypothetical protein